MHRISQVLKSKYDDSFVEHGPTPRGIRWKNVEQTELRYRKMLSLLDPAERQGKEKPSLLDVGCGYGGFYSYIAAKKIPVRYTGIDVSKKLLVAAAQKHPKCRWIKADILDFKPNRRFNYAICNGVLTSKFKVTDIEMQQYAKDVIVKMFRLVSKGIAFNLMTTRVDYTLDHIFFQDPVEMFKYCFERLSHKIRLDHSYPLFEYTIYLYHP